MKNVWKRTVSLFLAIVMILGNVPVNALATDTVETVSCDHANAQITELADATCDADGCTYWSCPDCNETWEEVIPAAGHAYASTELDTVIVYTCERCSHSYEEMKAVQDDTVQNDTVQEDTVQEDTVQEDAVQEAPAFMAPAPQSETEELSGYVWVDADSNTEPMDLIGVAANGGIRDAVLRAVNMYNAENLAKYTVYYTTVTEEKGEVSINVAASYRELLGYIDEATKLANDMKNSVSGNTMVPFEIRDVNGKQTIYIANVGFRSFKTLESADISLDIKYDAETAPDDLQTIIDNMVEEQAKVNGLPLSQLRAQPQSITVEVQEKTYVLPGLGQRDNVYTNIIKAVVIEGMTGEKATIYGGTVTLRNSTPKYDVTYYASVEDLAAGKAYAEESQFKGLNTPVPVNPVRTHYTFLGWLPVNASGTPGETTGVVTPIAGDAKYVAAWQAEQDEHTPGDVANNGVEDKIDDRDQTFVVTYYDDDGTTKIAERKVAYGGYLIHPTKTEVTKEGHVLKRWDFAAGQSGFIIKSNAAYKAVWEAVHTITYTDDDGTVYDAFTQKLKDGAVIRHPAAPTREGDWKFGGWEYVGQGEESATAKADVTFKAKWIKLHTVTFYNGETVIGTPLKVEDGNTIEYPAAPEAPEEGLVFGGWVVKQDGKESAAPTVAESDLDIYVKWLQRFTITYTDGVEGVEIFPNFPREITEGQSVIRPAVPAQREGYIFTGWEWVGEGEEPAVITRNETYQACWKPEDEVKTITITYTDGVKGEELFADIVRQVAENVTVDYPEITVTREGYDFGGWDLVSTDENGNQEHAVIWNKRPILTYTDGENDTVFEPKSFDVSYNSLIRHPGISDILPGGREGYVLDGWVTADGTEAPTLATADVTYKAVWKKMHTITFTDGVEDEVVFEPFTKDFKEGTTINAKVPADREGYLFKGWEKVDDTTYQATWKLVEITVTYGHVQDDGTVQTNTRVLDVKENTEGVSDTNYTAPAQSNSKKIYVGLYPVVDINGVDHWELVYASAVARSVPNIVHIPLGDEDRNGVDDIYEYAQKNALPAPVDPTTYKFTEKTRLYHLELPDVDSNGVVDGQYKLDPETGSVPVDDNGQEILEHEEKAVSTTYKWYDYRNTQVRGITSYYPYDESYALNPGDVEYPDYDNDGVIFVNWVHHPDPEFKDITEGYVKTYHMKGVVEPDINNNGIYDVNENVGVVIVENGDEENPREYESFTNNEITITLSAAEAGKKAPAVAGSAFLLDTKNGTNIEIAVDGEEGYAIKSVQVKAPVGNKTPVLAETPGGDNENVKNYKLTDASANNNTKDSTGRPEYLLTIYLDKLETKESDLVFDTVSLPEFTVQKVYESVVSNPKFDSSKSTVISYVAREAQEDVPVSIEPLFQWIKDNYGSYGETMVGLIDDNLESLLEEASMAGLVTVDSSTKTHYFHVKLEKKTAFVGDSISTPVKTAQDIANSHVNAYINELVRLMKTSANNTTALENHIAELIGLLSDIQKEANDGALIRPFGYNVKGEDVINESVVINVGGTIENGKIVGGKNLYTGNVKITDLRAPTNLTANGASVSVTYGTNTADAELKNKAGVSGVQLHVSYNNQVATTYPAGVAFPGSQTNRPANATFNLAITRQTANVQVPAKVVKEHNSSYEGQSPDPIVLVDGTAVSNVDVISVIAGVDLNKMDIDLQLSKDDTVTVKNVDPVAWIKLPGNLLTHVALVKKLDVDTSKFVNKMLEGENLPAADVAKINDLLNQFLNEDQVTCTLEEAIHLLEVFMPNAGAHQAKIEKALNAVKGTADGNVKVTFSGGYPEDPGFFLNMGIIADSNYNHGVSMDTNNKDFGVILNCPVLTMYNNGIQLISDEVPDAVHNVYTLENNGKTHALRVKDHEDAEIFYYGFDSGLAVHYEGDGQTPPTKAGMYLVSAFVNDNGVYKSDMAIMLIGVERTTTTVKGATVEYDGASHKLKVTTVDEEGEKVGRTIISGTIDKPANAGLKELRGLVNVDFPETIDNLWVHAVDYLESKFDIEKLPDTIQAAELTPEQTVEFLNYCKTKVENKEFDNVLVNKVQAVVVQTLDSLISAMNEIIGRTNGKVVTIQFKDDIGYERHGVYLYHAIATDIERNQLYIPSADSGILIIHAPEEDFQMENQEVPYNGEGQLPEIHDATSREQFLVIYNQNTLSFILGQDGNALLNKLEALGVKDGITVEELIEKGVNKISTEIVSGLITAGDALLEKIHKDDSELYQRAKDKLNAHVAARETQLVTKLESMLNEISEKVNPDTKLYFNKKPVDVGNYQVHAFSFGIAHEEATFKILPVITITAEDQNIYVGQDISREATDATYAVNPEDTQIVLPDDLGNITFSIYTAVEENGELVKGELVEAPLAAGTYFIEATAEEKEGYIIEAVTGTLTVEELTIVAYVNDKESETVAPGEKEENVTITVKALDKDGKEVTIPELTEAGYTIVDAENKTVEADVDGAGNVTKSALAKALETVGEYTIVPNAAEDFPEDRIKTAKLNVVLNDATLEKGRWTMSLDSVIYLNYYPTMSNFPANFDFANNGGVVIWTGSSRPTSGKDLYVGAPNCTVINGMEQNEQGEWRVKTHEIFAKNIGDMVYIRPFVKIADNEYIYTSGGYNYSPAMYCYDILNNSSEREDTRYVCAALLKYGASAQKYFHYNENALVTTINTAKWPNINLEDYDLTFKDNYLDPMNTGEKIRELAGTLQGTKAGITYKKATLDLQGAIRISVGYDVDTTLIDLNNVASAKVYFWSESDILKQNALVYDERYCTDAMDLYAEDPNADVKLGAYRGKSHHILAKNLSETVYYSCCIVTKDGNVYRSGLGYYSPEAFVDDHLNQSTGQIVDTCERIAVYGEMARRRFY